MTRVVSTAIVMAALLASTACSDMTGNKTSSLQTMQVSALHWDEMAAASTAAHVNNNGLIMMR